jgi:hypothetical protein
VKCGELRSRRHGRVDVEVDVAIFVFVFVNINDIDGIVFININDAICNSSGVHGVTRNVRVVHRGTRS